MKILPSKNLLILLIFFISTFQIYFGQNHKLFIPPSLENVYEGNTRNWDGTPGKGYWINRAEYKLNVTVNIDSSIISGQSNVAYFNNSPDTLKNIVIQLLQDRFKPGSQKDFKMNSDAFTDGFKLSTIIIEDSIINIKNNTIYKSSTNLYLKLPNPLPPSGKINISFNYAFKIQDVSPGRMGKYAEGVYDIAYWYPKIAVYDDVHGWDNEDYSGMLEFYSDFSDYKFEISVPSNFVVWATGELQNANTVLPSEIYERFVKAKNSDSVVRIITENDYKNGVFKNNGKIKTWVFEAKNVPDVSFAMSDHYLWDGKSVVVDSNTNRRTFAQAAYPDSVINWDRAAELTGASVSYLSHVMPAVPFPYSHMTSFCNGRHGGGMETPMMANDGAPKSFARFAGLIFHEIAHTYFPFYMGTNERNYAWMDEGWASFFPTKFVPEYDSNYSHYEANFTRAKKIFGSESNIPLMVTTKYLRGIPLYFNAYRHAFWAYSSLNDLLGDELFINVMQAYINRWNGKHPIPYDFFFTINDVAGKNYNWFIKKWFFDFAYCDLSIQNSEDSIIINNMGGLPVKIDLLLKYKNGNEKIIHKSPSVWENNNSIKIEVNIDELLSATILSDEIPDINQDNNELTWK